MDRPAAALPSSSRSPRTETRGSDLPSAAAPTGDSASGGFDRRGVLRLSALAGLGVTTLVLPSAASASSTGTGGAVGATGYTVRSSDIGVCSQSLTQLTVEVLTDGVEPIDDLRIRFRPDPFAETFDVNVPSAWFSGDEPLASPDETFAIHSFGFQNLILVGPGSEFDELGEAFVAGDFAVDVARFVDDQFDVALAAARLVTVICTPS
jgi:hypothetical protein